VSNKKQRDTAAQDAEILAKRQQEAEKSKAEESKGAAAAAVTATEEPETTDVLGQEDEDVIF
jgi:V-type H+-transporting ATPase subunit D